MAITPEFSKFEKWSSKFDAVPVSRCVLADPLTPVSAFSLIDDGRDACLFESVIGGEQVGRYSFLACGPHLVFQATRDQCIVKSHQQAVESNPATESSRGTPANKATASPHPLFPGMADAKKEGEWWVYRETRENPLEKLRELVRSVRVARVDHLPPFTGGAVGFAGYDVIRYVEHLPNAPADDRAIPDLAFAFYDNVLVFDNITKSLHVVALAWPERFPSTRAAYDDACRRIEKIIARLNAPLPRSVGTDVAQRLEPVSYESNFTRDDFMQAVERCVEYIRSGDIFQVVLSQRLQVPIAVDPFQIYRHLRVLNPSPFMFFLRNAGTTLVGASPEIMCRVVGDQVTVRPLAGTRPRGSTPDEDLKLERELLNDEKERAEHAMLVDLGRNDVGKVARYGSVKLVDQFSIERYSHVMHISSTVQGKLREDCDEFDAFMASHPAGTVSGAPKVRAMQIIDELEPHRRGPYAGAVGYIDYSGNMDTCIALRTMVIQSGLAYVQAGAGVVADSDPAMEYAETLNKAKAMLRAIEAAEDNDH